MWAVLSFGDPNTSTLPAKLPALGLPSSLSTAGSSQKLKTKDFSLIVLSSAQNYCLHLLSSIPKSFTTTKSTLQPPCAHQADALTSI